MKASEVSSSTVFACLSSVTSNAESYSYGSYYDGSSSTKGTCPPWISVSRAGNEPTMSTFSSATITISGTTVSASKVSGYTFVGWYYVTAGWYAEDEDSTEITAKLVSSSQNYDTSSYTLSSSHNSFYQIHAVYYSGSAADSTDYWIAHTGNGIAFKSGVTYYEISTAEELADLAYRCYNYTFWDYYNDGFSGYTFNLTADIDLAAYVWLPIGGWANASGTPTTSLTALYNPFAGTFNGNGYKITGLRTATSVSNTCNYRGLFGYVAGTSTSTAVVENVIVSGTVYGYKYVGGIVGYLGNYAKITQSSSRYNLSSCNVYGYQYTGGIVGYANKGSGSRIYIEYCYNEGEISGDQYVGGIAGGIYANSVTITKCSNSGTVKVGYTTTISSNGPYGIGGIVGRVNDSGSGYGIDIASGSGYSYITECYNTGSIRGYYSSTYYNYVGGIVGQCGNNMENRVYIGNCYNTGAVTAGSGVGGIVGYMGTCKYLYNSYNTALLSATGTVGGIVGSVSYNSEYGTQIYNCLELSGSPYSSGGNAGGIAGGVSSSATGSMSRCYYKIPSGDRYYAIGGTTYDTSGKGVGCASSTIEGYARNLSATFNTSSYSWSSCLSSVDDYSSYTWVRQDTLRSIDKTFNSGYPILAWDATSVTYNNKTSNATVKEAVTKNRSFTLVKYSDFGWESARGGSSSQIVYYSNGSQIDVDTYTISGTSGSGWSTSGITTYSEGATISGGISSSLSLYTVSGTSGDSSHTFKLKSDATWVGWTFIGWNTCSSTSDSGWASGWYYGGQSYYLSSGQTLNLYAYWRSNYECWSCVCSSDGGGWSGTTSFSVSSANGLAYVAYLINSNSTYASYNITLTADIDLSGYYWKPIGLNNTYTGTFDGNGHTISGLNMMCATPYDPNYWGGSSDNNIYMGLFAKSSGTIKNVIIKTDDKDMITVGDDYYSNTDHHYYQYSTTYIGGAVAYGTGSISKVGVIGASSTDTTYKTIYVRYSGSKSSYYTYAGGLVGYYSPSSFHTIDQCFSSVVIYEENSQGRRYYGGLIGRQTLGNFYDSDDEDSEENYTQTTQISNCFSNYYIRGGSTSSVYCGGFVGYSEGAASGSGVGLFAAEHCYSKGKIVGSAEYAGGFVGFAYKGCIKNSSVTTVVYLWFLDCFSVCTYTNTDSLNKTYGYAFGYGYTSFASIYTENYGMMRLSKCYYSSSYVLTSGSYVSSPISSAKTSASAVSSDNISSYFQSLKNSNGVKYWGNVTDSEISITSKTWIVGQDYLCDAYPMLTWCLSTVTLLDNPSGLSDSLQATNGTSLAGLYTWSDKEFTESGSFVVMTGVSFDYVVNKDTNLIFGGLLFGGWYNGGTRLTTSTSGTYAAGGNTSATDVSLVAKFTGVTITSGNVKAYLYDSSLSDVSEASGLGTVTISRVISSSWTTEVATIDFSSSSSPSFDSFDLYFSYTYSIVVTPSRGYVFAYCYAYDEDGGSFSVISNLSSSHKINGVVEGEVSFSISGTELYSGTDCASDSLRFRFVREVYELNYNVTDVDGNTSTVTRYVTLSGNKQTTIANKTTTQTGTTQDVYAVVGSATTHYYGVYWSLTGAYSLSFEDAASSYLGYMRSMNSTYACFALGSIITSNSSGPSFSFTLTASKITYIIACSTVGSGTLSSSTFTIDIDSTGALSGKSTATARNYYYFQKVTTLADTTTYLNYPATNTSTRNSSRNLYYYLIQQYCINNIRSGTMIASNPSTTHSNSNYLRLLYTFARGTYTIEVENNTSYTYEVSYATTSGGSSYTSEQFSAGENTAYMGWKYERLTFSSAVSMKCDSKNLSTSSDEYNFTELDFWYDANPTAKWGGGANIYGKTSSYCYSQTSVTKTLVVNYAIGSVETQYVTHEYTEGTAPTKTNGVYYVSSVENLQWIANLVANGKTFSGSKFVQTCDIDLSGVDNWSPIGYYTSASDCKAFSGTYDGGGYRILKLTSYIDDPETEKEGSIGLFGYTNGATIRNLTIDGGAVSGFENVGAYVGYAVSTTLKNLNNKGCSVSATRVGNGGSVTYYGYDLANLAVKGSKEYNNYEYSSNFGGIVGYASSCTISACSNNGGSLSGASSGSYIGGVVGYMSSGKISESFSTSVSSNYSVELLGGGSSYSMSNCYWYSKDDGAIIYYYLSTGASSEAQTTTAPTESNCSNYSTYWTTVNGNVVLKVFYW